MGVTAVPNFYDEKTGKRVKAYSLFIRGKERGKSVYYVRLRNRDGEKLSVHISTHKTEYAEAERWVLRNYDTLVDNYIHSMINRDNKQEKMLEKSLFEYFKRNSEWLELDRRFGIERLEKANREYNSLIERHLVPYLAEHKLFKYTDITAQAVYDFQIDCVNKNISSKNISDMLYALKLLYKRLMAQGVIEGSPFIGVRQVKREKSKEKGMFEVDKVKHIFNRVWENSGTEYLFHLAACMTGMRNSEIRLLKAGDFETINGIHFVNLTNSRNDGSGMKTANAVRKIPLHNFVYEKLRNYIAENRRTGYIFLNERGKIFSASEVSNMIGSAGIAIGVDRAYLQRQNITFHSWRHLFNTILYESGTISSDWIEYFMGHRQKGVKAVYTHLNTVEGRDACEKMLKVLEEKIL
jgi:integrase